MFAEAEASTLRVLPGHARGRLVATAATIVAAVVAVAAAVLADTHPGPLAGLTAVLIVGLVWHRALLRWRSLLASIILVILFIPIKRYALPAALPIQLEPYRAIVALVAVCWLTSALIDPRVRLRRAGVVDAPIAAFLVICFLSLLLNGSRVASVGPDAMKAMLFFLSFVTVLYLTASLVRSLPDVDFLVSVLLGGGAFLAALALAESRTHYNVFDHLSQFVPILQETGPASAAERGGRVRVFASGQHPIALGAAFAMLVPVALARALTARSWRWWLALALVLMGSLTTVSRTAVVMLVVSAIVFAILRPADMKRLLPAVILPALIAVHFALPGTIGTLRESFFPKGGLIAEQANAPVGSGRIATLGPALRKEFVPNPVLGEGFGTRVTSPDEYVPVPNGPILDNEWAQILMETGIVGALILLWLFVRFAWRAGRAARRDPTPRGYLLAGISAAVTAYAVSMFTYDALSFIQVTFLLFIFVGIGSAALALEAGAARRPAPAPVRRPEPARVRPEPVATVLPLRVEERPLELARAGEPAVEVEPAARPESAAERRRVRRAEAGYDLRGTLSFYAALLRRREPPLRHATIARVALSTAEARRGGVFAVEAPGSAGRTVAVTIPGGVWDGQVLRVADEPGEPELDVVVAVAGRRRDSLPVRLLAAAGLLYAIGLLLVLLDHSPL